MTRGTYLISAFLQQTLHKLPVGLSDDRRGQVGQFGLPDGGAQVTSLLDVLLKLHGVKCKIKHAGLIVQSTALF